MGKIPASRRERTKIVPIPEASGAKGSGSENNKFKAISHPDFMISIIWFLFVNFTKKYASCAFVNISVYWYLEDFCRRLCPVEGCVSWGIFQLGICQLGIFQYHKKFNFYLNPQVPVAQKIADEMIFRSFPPSNFWCASFGKYQFKPFQL